MSQTVGGASRVPDVRLDEQGQPTAEPMVDERVPTQLAKDCPLDIYLSGNDGAGHGATYFPWPYRMNNPKEIGGTYVNNSDVFILDSGINHDDITNEDVFKKALAFDPDYVFPADLVGDPDTTTERVLDFLNEMDDAGVTADPIIPLQPTQVGGADHHKHYPDLEAHGDYFAVGGVKDAPAATKRRAVENVRRVAGDDVRLHGLGFGVAYFQEPRVLRKVMLDSLDSSGPIQQADNGVYWSFVDGELTRHETERPKGDYPLFQIAMLSGVTLVSLARMVMENEAEVGRLGHRQSGLEVHQ